MTSLDRDPAAVRAAVLRARGYGEPHQGAAAGPVRGPDFCGDAAGEPVAAVLGPVRGGAAGGVATTRAGGDGAGAGAVRTIRALLLKVAAVVRVSVRGVWVSLSAVFPRQELFAHSLARLRAETPG